MDKPANDPPAVDKKNTFQDIQAVGSLSRDGVFIYHIAENRFIYVNPSLERILEINSELLKQDPAIIFGAIIEEDQEYIRSHFVEVVEKGLIEDIQVRVRQHKTEKILSCNCYISANKANIIGFIKDISKPRQHEDYLVNFGARKDAILDMVSQRLSTPLYLSKFTVDRIEKAVQEGKFGKLDAHINIIRDVTAQCIDVIEGFLKEEHLTSPSVHTTASRFDIVAKTMIVLEKLKQSIPEKNFKFQCKEEHLFVNADDVKFFQIVHNLLSNSIKFTNDKGIIKTTIRNHETKVELIIEDDGIGIPEHLQPYIFDKNTRAARKGLRGEGSIGIGLYVIKKLAERMNAKISFTSKENKGTTFILELPKE